MQIVYRFGRHNCFRDGTTIVITTTAGTGSKGPAATHLPAPVLAARYRTRPPYWSVFRVICRLRRRVRSRFDLRSFTRPTGADRLIQAPPSAAFRAAARTRASGG